MLKFAVILLALLTMITPILAVLFIIDRDKKAVFPLLVGGGLFTVMEACLVLPVINYLGYNIIVVIIGVVLIEVIRWLVLSLYLRKDKYQVEKILYFFAGYICVNLFVVWGIDAVATASVVLLSDFSMFEQGEIWISMLMAFVKVAMVYSYTALVSIAIKQLKIRYVFAAAGLHILTEESIIMELCGMLNINEGIGIILLVSVALILLIVTDRMSHLWKGNGNED